MPVVLTAGLPVAVAPDLTALAASISFSHTNCLSFVRVVGVLCTLEHYGKEELRGCKGAGGFSAESTFASAACVLYSKTMRETVEEVLQAEEEAKEKVRRAREEAERRTGEAEKEAERITREAREAASGTSKERLEQARREAEEEAGKEKRAARERAEALKKERRATLDEVVEQAVRFLTTPEYRREE